MKSSLNLFFCLTAIILVLMMLNAWSSGSKGKYFSKLPWEARSAQYQEVR